MQPTGEYHYHGVSRLVAEVAGSGDDLVHVGFAANGYLIYHSRSGAYEPNWELSTERRRLAVVTGPFPSADAPLVWSRATTAAAPIRISHRDVVTP